MELGVGEALVSTLEKKGQPSIVQRTLIRPPSSRLGPLTDDERNEIISASEMKKRYADRVDRESAYEILKKRQQEIEERRSDKGGTVGGRRDTEYVRHGEFKVPGPGSRSKSRRSKRGRSRSRRQSL